MKRFIFILLLLPCLASAQGVPFAFWKSGAAVPSFSPADIDSLKYWLEADNIGVAKSDGDTTYTWQNLAATGQTHDVFQLTSSAKPLYRDSSGVEFIRFDGTDDALRVDNKWLYTQPATIFLVARYRFSGATTRVFFSAYGSTRQAIFTTSVGALDVLFAGSSGATSNSSTDSLSTYIGYYSGASSWYERNGNRKSPISAGTNGMDGLSLGSDANTLGGNTGIDIYGFYYFHKELTPAEIASMRTYIQTKWGTP